MLGAIYGDIVGSVYEFNNIKTKDFELFNREEDLGLEGLKKAKLSYKVLDCATDNGIQKTTLEIYMYTGRSHQIRVQFSHRGMPLIGDGKYGAKDNEKNIALYCSRITFNHPRTKEELTFNFEG